MTYRHHPDGPDEYADIPAHGKRLDIGDEAILVDAVGSSPDLPVELSNGWVSGRAGMVQRRPWLER